MNAEVIERLLTELREAFPGATSTQDGTRTLVKLPAAQFPKGCKPVETEALVVLTPGAAKPELYVKAIPLRPDGGTPRNASPTSVAGEPWCTFSFNVQWEESRHTAVQFVMAGLARFGRNE